MRPLLLGEWRKLSSTRTAIGFLVATLVLTLGPAALVFGLNAPTSVEDAESGLRDLATPALLLAMLFGAVGVGAEFRHSTITPTVLAAGDRVRPILAATVAYGLAGALLALVSIGLLCVTAELWLPAKQTSVSVPWDSNLELIGGGMLAAALVAAVGTAVGAILRNQAVAVSVLLIVFLVIEPIISGLAERVWSFSLGASVSALIGGGATDDLLRDRWQAALVLTAWAVVLVLVAALLQRERDVP